MNINLFFLLKDQLQCIATTQDSIPQKYDRKLTLELESAKKWTSGANNSRFVVNPIPPEDLALFDDSEHFYIRTEDWFMGGFSKPGYLAIEKKVANGGLFATWNAASVSFTGRLSQIYLFVE